MFQVINVIVTVTTALHPHCTLSGLTGIDHTTGTHDEYSLELICINYDQLVTVLIDKWLHSITI